MIIIGIDPGPKTCGVVVYDTEARHVIEAHKAMPVADAIESICGVHSWAVDHVAIERVKAGRFAGDDYLLTAEVVGRCQQAAIVARLPYTLHYRSEVLRYLDLLGSRGNRDALVRAELIAMHGGTKQIACGTKKAPGPLFGVSSHAWQALGLAYACWLILESKAAKAAAGAGSR